MKKINKLSICSVCLVSLFFTTVYSDNWFYKSPKVLKRDNGSVIEETYGYERAKLGNGAGDWNKDGLIDIITTEGYKGTFKVWLNSGTKESYKYTDPLIFGKDEVLKDPDKSSNIT